MSGLPPALEHGDLWASNVYVGAGEPAFIDWSDASLSHPFLSLAPLLRSAGWDPHLAMRAEHDGVDETAARRRLGNVLHTREAMRRVWIAAWWDALRQDAHFTWRSWRATSTPSR